MEPVSRLLRAGCQQVLTQQFSVWQMWGEATSRSGKWGGGSCLLKHGRPRECEVWQRPCGSHLFTKTWVNVFLLVSILFSAPRCLTLRSIGSTCYIAEHTQLLPVWGTAVSFPYGVNNVIVWLMFSTLQDILQTLLYLILVRKPAT